VTVNDFSGHLNSQLEDNPQRTATDGRPLSPPPQSRSCDRARVATAARFLQDFARECGSDRLTYDTRQGGPPLSRQTPTPQTPREPGVQRAEELCRRPPPPQNLRVDESDALIQSVSHTERFADDTPNGLQFPPLTHRSPRDSSHGESLASTRPETQARPRPRHARRSGRNDAARGMRGRPWSQQVALLRRSPVSAARSATNEPRRSASLAAKPALLRSASENEDSRACRRKGEIARRSIPAARLQRRQGDRAPTPLSPRELRPTKFIDLSSLRHLRVQRTNCTARPRRAPLPARAFQHNRRPPPPPPRSCHSGSRRRQPSAR